LLADTHCHLDFNVFDQDRDEVLARAKESGLEFILNPGIDLQSSRAAVQLAEKYPEVFAAVGVHPNDALSWNAEALDELRILARRPKVVAIGEIGLDYYRDRAPQDLQKSIFRNQLALAAEEQLPVVIHTRDASAEDRQATADALAILNEWHTELVSRNLQLSARPGVLHSYSGGEAYAEKAIELNLMIGITGPVTFRNAPDLQRVVTGLPIESLLVETDAPFLTPHPFRGQRNEPAYVRYVVEKIAQLHNLSFEAVAQATYTNTGLLFKWREIR